MSDFFRKHSMITGTLLLTAAGFAVRILGFFYRIFLSRTIGAEGLGLYNMVHPLYGICFALCAGSIQTAISRCIAANVSRRKLFFRTGLMISLSIAAILAVALSAGSRLLADYVLLESRCGELLRLMAFSIPFSAIHACVNGYYYGMQRTRVPAASQITEQLIRMGVVFLMALFFQNSGIPITTELAVLGHLAGEAGSCFYAALTFLVFDHTARPIRPAAQSISNPTTNQQAFHMPLTQSHSALYKQYSQLTFSPSTSQPTSPAVSSTLQAGRELMSMALPLMGNRLVLNLLSSAEAIWIPSRLVLSGLTSSEAFEIYGVLTGMALPFIFFPSAITNSMAVILLPAVAGAQADGREHHIREAVLASLRYSLYMGILCIGVFTCFGDFLGNAVFKESAAGYYMKVLAWLCPFLYLATTTGSILNGLGKTNAVFLQNTAALSLRLAFVFFGIPHFGIHACLWGMLASELFLSTLHLYTLKGLVSFSIQPWDMILKPTLYLLISVGICLYALPSLPWFAAFPAVPTVLLQICLLPSCYILLLALSHFSRHNPVS